MAIYECTKDTRMYSSRMRTARLLPVSPSVHCSWGKGAWFWVGVCSWGSAWSQGCLLLGAGPRGVPGPGGLLCVVVSQHALRQTPLPREQNHRHV